jgi:hypothetical protein
MHFAAAECSATLLEVHIQAAARLQVDVATSDDLSKWNGSCVQKGI